MRTIVIGDIHGCYAELLQLLAKVEITGSGAQNNLQSREKTGGIDIHLWCR